MPLVLVFKTPQRVGTELHLVWNYLGDSHFEFPALGIEGTAWTPEVNAIQLIVICDSTGLKAQLQQSSTCGDRNNLWLWEQIIKTSCADD